MSWRTVVISSRCKLDLKMDSMVIRGNETKRIFLDEIAILSPTGIIKSAGIEICNDYEGETGDAERIIDYMELVREFERDKLFITVNMRSFFSDEVADSFMKTVVSHGFKIFMIEASEHTILENERRIKIDKDLCEF